MSKWKQRKTAKERIEILFEEAEKAALCGDIDFSDRYVTLARKIGMKYNVNITSEYRRRFCKDCYSYLFPGKTCKVRINKGKIVTKCLKCKTINRFVISKKDVDKNGSKKSKD